MRTTKMMIFALLAAFLTVGLTACGGGDDAKKDDEMATEQPGESQVREVSLYQYRFNPNTVTVAAGTTVQFENKDPDRHNISIPQLNIDQNLAAGETFSHTFETTGEFAVTNRFASRPMKMTIVVE